MYHFQCNPRATSHAIVNMDTRTPYRYLSDTKIYFSILTPWASRRELYPSFIPTPNFPSSKLGYHVRLRATGYVYFLQVPVPSVEVIKTQTTSLVQSPIISKRTSSIEKSHPSSRIRLREWNVYHRHRLIRIHQASMTGYQNDRWRLEAIWLVLQHNFPRARIGIGSRIFVSLVQRYFHSCWEGYCFA